MKVLLAALLAILLTGCATMQRGDMKRSHDVDVYPATRTNLDLIANPRKYDIYYIFFPVAALVDAPTGRLAVYYGAADTTTCMAFGYVHELVAFARAAS